MCAGGADDPSHFLQVFVPAKGLPTAAKVFSISTAATLGISAVTCGVAALVTPGWTTVACAAGVLRSLGHLQLMAFTSNLAAHMPRPFQVAADSASWARLDFAPYAATSFITKSSRLVNQLVPTVPSPPPPLGEATGLDAILRDFVLAETQTPLLAYASSSPNMTMSKLVGPKLVWDASMALDPRDEVRAAWRHAMATWLLGLVTVAVALAMHGIVRLSVGQAVRLAGRALYVAFPKLALLALCAVLPPIIHATTHVYSWERLATGVNGIALALWIPAIVLAVALAAYLLWLTAGDAPKHIIVRPDDVWAVATGLPPITDGDRGFLATYLQALLGGRSAQQQQLPPTPKNKVMPVVGLDLAPAPPPFVAQPPMMPAAAPPPEPLVGPAPLFKLVTRPLHGAAHTTTEALAVQDADTNLPGTPTFHPPIPRTVLGSPRPPSPPKAPKPPPAAPPPPLPFIRNLTDGGMPIKAGDEDNNPASPKAPAVLRSDSRHSRAAQSKRSKVRSSPGMLSSPSPIDDSQERPWEQEDGEHGAQTSAAGASGAADPFDEWEIHDSPLAGGAGGGAGPVAEAKEDRSSNADRPSNFKSRISK